MAIKLIDETYCHSAGGYLRSYVMDSATDAKNLPESCAGSTAEVVGGAMYIVNASGEWEEL